MRYHIPLIMMCFLAASTLVPEATAAATVSDFTIAVQPESVSVSVQLHMHQNITVLRGDLFLPRFRVVAEGPNSTDTLQSLQDAIRVKSPQAQVSDVRLVAETTAWSNSTGLQWFNITLTFNLRGISSTSAESSRADLVWKSFAVGQNVSLGAVEANKVGAKYLMDAARFMAAQQGLRFVTVTYQVMTRPVAAARFAEFVGRMTVLNFSQLERPLSEWQSSYTALSDKRTFSLSPRQSLGMSMTRTIQELEAESASYGLFYTLKGEVAVPGGSSLVEDDIVTMLLSHFPETIMGAIVVAAAALGSGTYLYERRILNSSPRKRSKRKL